MTKILILGANGSLGRQFVTTLNEKRFKLIKFTRKNFNLNGKLEEIEHILKNKQVSFVINCIGLTGLIYCETKKTLANRVNGLFPIKLARLTSRYKTNLIHFSTEAVFSGRKIGKLYKETDIPRPSTVYGKTKALADKKILKFNNVLIIRLPLLFGPTHKNQIVGKLLNNLKKNKKIYVASDVYSTPIYTPNLCNFILKNYITKKNLTEKKIIHFTSNQRISIYDLVKKLSKKFKIGNSKNIIEVKDNYFKSKVKIKPKNLGLTSIYKNCRKKSYLI